MLAAFIPARSANERRKSDECDGEEMAENRVFRDDRQPYARRLISRSAEASARARVHAASNALGGELRNRIAPSPRP